MRSCSYTTTSLLTFEFYWTSLRYDESNSAENALPFEHKPAFCEAAADTETREGGQLEMYVNDFDELMDNTATDWVQTFHLPALIMQLYVTSLDMLWRAKVHMQLGTPNATCVSQPLLHSCQHQ